MANPELPVRRRPPWLPPLRYQVSDQPMWWYRQRAGQGEGACRLRVWRAGPGHLAVVSWLGFGLPVTDCIPDLWYDLAAILPGPLALAEQDGENVRLADIQEHRVSWHRLYPALELCEHRDYLESWWLVYGAVILLEGRTRLA